MSAADATADCGTGCKRILTGGSLDAKLAPVAGDRAGSVLDSDPATRLVTDAMTRPARDPELRFARGGDPLPRPHQLGDPLARARCLARFAHHELMAVELFAWALLRWPELPREMGDDLLCTLADEQLHCALYVDRLAALDTTLAAHPSTDYIWRRCVVAEGPRAFLCAMGLTLEQANLDFSLRYAAAFHEAGDPESADVLERVHEDEVLHVASAAAWLRELDADRDDEVARYEAAVPFPLSAARAKGRPFYPDPRRRAGLGERFIEHVRRARSRQELGGAPR